MSGVMTPRPSDGRRAALRQADAGLGEKGVPVVSNFFPIERYYDAARKVLASFEMAFDERRLDDAYVYGKRFATFSLDALPTHNYYKSPKHKLLRTQNALEMTDVILKLEQIAKWMDDEEIKRERERRKLMEEKKRRDDEQEARRYKDFQDRVNQLKRPTGQTRGNVEQSALNKLEMLGGPRPNASSEKPGKNYGAHGTVSYNGSYSSQEETHWDRDRKNLDSELDERDPELHKLRNRDDASSGRGGDASRRRQQDDAVRRERRRRSSDNDTNRRRSLGTVDEKDRNDSEVEKARRQHRREEDETTGRQSSYLRRQSNESNVSQDSRNSRSNQRERRSDEPLPPPIPPPLIGEIVLPPPPSYKAVVSERIRDPQGGLPRAEESLNRRQLIPPPADSSLSNQRPATVNPSSEPTYCNRDKERQKQSMRNTENVPMRILRENFISDYKKLKQERRIEIFGINTFQGRNSNSTNGCAVISPLVVSRHLKSSHAVPDEGIVDVIDSQCVPLLREIRGKLGLGGDALIIPSDVHDHLVDHKYLSQDWFIGAIGGNIMDPCSVAEFVKMLDQGDEKGSYKDKRTGATLFFHEHVVSVVKVPASKGRFYFDLIDSMPGLIDKNNRRMATRTRCRDTASFEALIRWYASSKFSESNCNWIDKNDWDETMAEIDPRVFQGFVWGEAATQ